MKKLVSVQEVSGEGLEALLGENVMLFCMNYIYSGTLAGVNTSCVLLENPSIVYETGAFAKSGYTNSERLHTEKLYVQTAAIESFCVGK